MASMALALAFALCLGLAVPAMAAEEGPLPDWYFLFAIFKNVDADCEGINGNTVRAKYSMTQNEASAYHNIAKMFEEYMNSFGVMCAHVDVVEVDTTVTELCERENGSYLDAEKITTFLPGEVNLDKYDHVTAIISLNVDTSYVGAIGSPFENGTYHSCINSMNRTYCQQHFLPGSTPWILQVFVHEFLHSMERLSGKWGESFDLHLTAPLYKSSADNWKTCYTDMMLNRAQGNEESGTGVHPVAWQYPPHRLRTMTELTIPSGITSLTSVTVLRYNTNVNNAFFGCKKFTIHVPSGSGAKGQTMVQISYSLLTTALENCTSTIDKSDLYDSKDWMFIL